MSESERKRHTDLIEKNHGDEIHICVAVRSTSKNEQEEDQKVNFFFKFIDAKGRLVSRRRLH